ncbi:tetratricopeptide repeat-containing sensor histidine kinase [Natronoflexus pectinivorans]|uniref:Histidine kinase/DNA gyrase B/HSP90-like ATPase n=1 Tax=Natronoflexus pectinivorans TaxID=682526 RepID=A0A4R2GIG3_9BACT|nr:tetratricopeptide repeat protein [Natronoflexus pectinivorans]TCO08308.1 histidine kinase/DNA gyrase B/HSP90-like ATPase [Natronoflexus pectinivorans]
MTIRLLKYLSHRSLFLFLLILSGLFYASCNTQSSRNQAGKAHLGESPMTDSMVVDQLIQRSRSFYDETGMRAEPYDRFLQEAMEIASRHNLMWQQVRILNTIGRRYRDRSAYGEALRYHNRALTIAQNINNKDLLSEVYNQIGVVFRRTDDNAIALDMHFKALRLAEETRDSFNISVAINSIGNVNANLGRYHSAIEYFLRALDYATKLDNTLGKAINNHNIGECRLKMGYPDEALEYFQRSLAYNNQIGSRAGQSICYNSIGAVYIAKDDPVTALEYLERALNINDRLGDLMQVSISHSKIGEVYLLLGDFAKADDHLNKSYELAKNIGSRFQAEESLRLLSRLHEANHNYSTSLEYFKTATAYRDSILNEKNINHLTTMEAMLETEAQRNRIYQLDQVTSQQLTTLSRQRLMLTIIFIVLIILTVITTLLIYQHRLRIKYNNLKNQHKLLRSQMNPHFIFNALSAIQVYVLEHDVEKSTKFLTDFAKLMRLVLKTSHHDYIPLKDESEILKYYLELQQLRFVSPFNYQIIIDESLNQDQILVPPMLTQPFVENAVEHGVKLMEKQGHLDIRFKKLNTQMVVEVEDNGIGISSSIDQKHKSGISKKHESMAIKITKERLDVIRNDIGGKVSLEIIDKKNINPFDRGTLIRIILPIVSQNN